MLFKYPFFQYGARYAAVTGESLLDGYKKLGKGVLIFYFILTRIVIIYIYKSTIVSICKSVILSI